MELVVIYGRIFLQLFKCLNEIDTVFSYVWWTSQLFQQALRGTSTKLKAQQKLQQQMILSNAFDMGFFKHERSWLLFVIV